jgi:hypothetical protein
MCAMTTNEYGQLTDPQKFELLDRPEDWPEDPAAQAELSDLLELQLALSGHASELAEALRPRRTPLAPLFLAAAAALLAIVPTLYVVQRNRSLHAAVHQIDQEAQRRAQDRLWSGFFTQSSGLIQDFQKNPRICGTQNEDRNAERETATVLLQVSHQLAGQGAPVPEAEQVRKSLQSWLTELSLEDGCLSPARAEELRQWAMAHKLEDEAVRMGRLLRQEGS